MNYRRILPAAGLVLSLYLGLALPFLTAALQDRYEEGSVHPLAEAASAHYAYQGTLANRVLALNAFLNQSPAVRYLAEDTDSPPPDLWEPLCVMLPLEGEAEASASGFSLAPRQYTAEYRYQELHFSQEATSVLAYWDEEAAVPLRIELRCPPERLTALAQSDGLWSLLHGYGRLLGYEDLRDDDSAASEIFISQSAQVRGTQLLLTAVLMPRQGRLLLKLDLAAQ